MVLGVFSNHNDSMILWRRVYKIYEYIKGDKFHFKGIICNHVYPFSESPDLFFIPEDC